MKYLFAGMLLALLQLLQVGSVVLSPYCNVNKNPQLYLFAQMYEAPAEEYINGFNLTYTISSQTNPTTVSVTTPTVPLSTQPNKLATIVSSDVFLSANNSAFYAVLEFVNGTGYNMYFLETPSPLEAPSFEVPPVYTIPADSGEVCLSIAIMTSNAVVASCFINQTAAQMNTYYVANTSMLVNNYTFNDWVPSWAYINSRKIVKFSYFPTQQANGVYLAIATPTIDIVPSTNPGNLPNNTVYIYWFNTNTNVLTNQTMVYANNLNQSKELVLLIQDIAATGEQIVILDLNYIYTFYYNFTSTQIINPTSYKIDVPAFKIGVYQNGFTTTAVLAQYLAITQYTFIPGQAQPMVEVYPSPTSLQGTLGVFVTANYVAIQLPNTVFVYERENLNFQNLYGVYGGGLTSSNYAFKLLLNNYAITIGSVTSSIYSVSNAYIQASINQNDTWVLTATSTTPSGTTSCSSVIGVTQLPSLYQEWGVYSTNSSYNQLMNGLTLPNGANQKYNLNRDVAGFNISYSVSSNDNPNINYTNYNYVNIAQPAYQQIIYSPQVPGANVTIFQYSYAESDNSFLYFTQDSSLNLWIQTCNVNNTYVNETNYNCGLYYNTAMSGKIINVVMQQIAGMTSLMGIALENSNFVNFYNFTNLTQAPFQARLSNYLTDIELIGEFLVVAEANIQIQIFMISGYSASSLTIINSTTAYVWLNNGDWTPLQIHSAPQIPNRIYVETNAGVWVLGFAFTEIQVYYFSYIALTDSLPSNTYSRDVQAWGNYLISIEASIGKQSSVLEFSLSNPYSPYSTHNVQLPGASPTVPVVSTVSDNSRLVYFLVNYTGNSTTTSTLYIYCLRIGTTSLDTIYKAIQYATVPTSVPASMYYFSLSGNNEADWLIFSDGYQNTVKGWWVNENPILTVQTQPYSDTVNINAKNYIEPFSYNFVATGGYQNNIVSTSVNLNVLNSDILVLSNQFVINGNTVFSPGNASSVTVNPFSWFQGTVFNYTLANGTGNFSLVPKLSSASQSNFTNFTNLTDVVSMQSINGTVVLLSITGSLYIYNATDVAMNNMIPLNSSLGFLCSKVFIQQYNSIYYSYSMCTNTNTNGWSLILYNLNNMTFTNYSLPGLSQYTSVLFVNPTAFIVIDAQIEAHTKVSQGSAKLYTISSGYASLANTIGGGTCGLSNNFNTVSGRLLWSSYSNQTVGLALLDGFGQGLAVLTLNLTGGYACSQTSSVLNLATSLQSQNGLVPNNAVYNTFYIVYSSSNPDSAVANYTILLNLGNAPIYQFTIAVNFSSGAGISGPSVNFNNLTAIYTNYSPLDIIYSDFQINTPYQFSVVYANRSSYEMSIAVYDFTNPSANYVPSFPSNVNYRTLSTMYLPLQSSLFLNQFFPFNTWLSNPSNPKTPYLFLWTNFDSTLSPLLYNPNLVLKVNQNFTKNTTVLLRFDGNSPFGVGTSSYTQNFTFYQVPTPSPSPSNGPSSLLWIWILLGILGAIILVGVVFFIIKRRQNKSIDYGNNQALVEDA